MWHAARIPASVLLALLASAPLVAVELPVVARLGGSGFRHGGSVTAVALSSDATRLACRGRDGVVRLWTVADGKSVGLLRTTTGDSASLTFSPDGKRLATAGPQGVVVVCDAAKAATLWSFRTAYPTERAAPLAWSPRGDVLAVATDQGVVLLDGRTGKERSTLTDCPVPTTLAFAPDGKTLVGAGSRGVVFWDADATGKWILAVREGLLQERTVFRALAFSPDGKVLTIADARGELRFCNPSTGETLTSHPLDGVQATGGMMFTPCGKCFAALRSSRSEGDLTVLSVETGKELRTYPLRNRPRDESDSSRLAAVASARDGDSVRTLLAMPDGPRIRVWDLEQEEERHPPTGHLDTIQAIAFSPDGRRIATAGSDSSLRVWDAVTGEELEKRTFVPRRTPGHLLLDNAGWARYVDGQLESLTPSDRRGSDFGRGSRTSIGAASPDGRLCAVFMTNRRDNGEPGTIDLFDARSEQRLRSITVNPVSTNSTIRPQFTPDGLRLFAIHEAQLLLWDVASGRSWRRVALPAPGPSDGVVFSPDGRLFLMSAAGGAVVIEVLSGKPRLTLDGVEMSGAVFSPDGRWLAAVRNTKEGRQTELIDAVTGQTAALLTVEGPRPPLLRFSPDGERLALQEVGGVVTLFDVSEVKAPTGQALSAERLIALWDELAAEDTARAHRAVWALCDARPAQVETLFRERFATVAEDLQRQIARLVEQLDDDDFATRERASDGLAGMGSAAGATLRKTLDGQPSAEVRRRVSELLDTLGTSAGGAHPKVARLGRAVEVLERLGTSGAREILEQIAKGTPEGEPAREAQAALVRLGGK